MTETVFETKAYKESLMENKLLHSLLYGLSKTLEEEIEPRMGYSGLSRIGRHMIKYLKKDGFEPCSSQDPYERIQHLCKFYTEEGMAKKIHLKKDGSKVKLKASQPFGSSVFYDLQLEKGLKHIRP